MTNAGKNLGGIRTLDDVRARCTVDADSGCWTWTLSAVTARGCIVPVAWFPAQGRLVTVPRIVWQLSGEDPQPSVWRTCANDRCCARAHLAGGTKAAWGAFLRDTKRWQGKPEIAARNRKSRVDHKLAKLTPALATMIHQSPLRNCELARMLNVSQTAIGRVRLRKTWPGSEQGQIAPRLYDVADLLQRVSPDRTHRRLLELPGTRQHTRATVPATPGAVTVTICESVNHDPRYQVAPGKRVFGAGFAAVGVGRDIETGRPWGA